MFYAPQTEAKPEVRQSETYSQISTIRILREVERRRSIQLPIERVGWAFFYIMLLFIVPQIKTILQNSG